MLPLFKTKASVNIIGGACAPLRPPLVSATDPKGRRTCSWSILPEHPYTAKNATVVASCQFYRLVATCQHVATSLSNSSSCNKSVKTAKNLLNKLQQTCKNNQFFGCVANDEFFSTVSDLNFDMSLISTRDERRTRQ